ncbi:hypothetical protein KPL44_24005 [Clostridium sp. DSM 17811]|nr:hypothetical protein [Clostridium sp. DSM 17811]
MNTENEQRVKLDEILKSLFAVSKKVLITMMNSLFKEDFDVEMTEITFENNEFVSDDYDIIRGDLFLKISKGNKPYHYHIELQTKNDATMEQIKKKYGEGSYEIKETIMEAKKISETISKEGSQLFNNAEIDGDDLHRILLAVANLFEYLNTKYGDDEKLNEEVRNMTKTLYDPAVEQRGIEKGIEKGIEQGIEQGDINAREEMVKEMLLDGESIVKIKKYSKLSEEEIEKIKNKITQ